MFFCWGGYNSRAVIASVRTVFVCIFSKIENSNRNSKITNFIRVDFLIHVLQKNGRIYFFKKKSMPMKNILLLVLEVVK